MKARTFLFIVLSCLLVVGCKKSQNEPEEPLPQETPTVITEEQLMSYFPYKNGDRILFERYDLEKVIYTVEDVKTSKDAGKIHLDISMSGTEYLDPTTPYYITLTAEVTDKQFKIDFSQQLYVFPATKGNYVYEGKGEELPETITFSNNAVIKKDKGLIYYKDADSGEWNFLKRL